eukprot:6521368-Ditylum_brightwellii.AAC.1
MELAMPNLRAGEKAEVGLAIGIVIKKAKSFEDKNHIFATLIKSLVGQNKMQDAMYIGFTVLTKLGVYCTLSPPDKSVIMKDIMEIKMILAKTTEAELMNFREMKDKNMITAM